MLRRMGRVPGVLQGARKQAAARFRLGQRRTHLAMVLWRESSLRPEYGDASPGGYGAGGGGGE